MTDSRILEIERRLEAIEQERKKLASELSHLRSVRKASELPPTLGTKAALQIPKTPEEKTELFLKLFCGRESVYPKLWENPVKGTKGYSPACQNEWVRPLCGKPQVKCSECPNQAFPRLDAQAVKDHLQGKFTIGTYAIRENDSCIFLAADFDGDGWSQDIIAYRAAAREIGVQVEIERSRSGNGGHAWIFFEQAIPARTARQLGTVIVARSIASRHAISLSTYDRFFPNQDFLPKGGFGNLIALPLQKGPRDQQNSIFLLEDLSPPKEADDQWQILADARRLSLAEVQMVLERQFSRIGNSQIIFENEDVALAEKAIDSGTDKVITGSYPGQIEIEAGAQLSINLDSLPSSIISAFKRTATFANPVFFEKERMRFSTWNIPRFIFCGELQLNQMLLPRGSLDSCLAIASKAGANVLLKDVKPTRTKLKLSFKGELSPEQKKAVSAMAENDIGVLVAPPGAGKTVMGCALIAKRRAPTLILVHRMPLVEQWKAQLQTLLGINPKEIGIFGGQRKKQTGEIDIGMLQTLAKLDNPEEALSQYEHLVIDECHHIPAVSFERVLKRCPARYVLGLTATPYRKDGHQSIIHMQCGPLRYEMKHLDGPELKKRVIIRETTFKMPEDAGPQPPIHLVWEHLVADPGRLRLVARDLRFSLENGRFPLVISERKEHLALLEETFRRELADVSAKAFTLTGGMGKKARSAVIDEIKTSIGSVVKPYVLATGSFIGEGFDMPALQPMASSSEYKMRWLQMYQQRLQ